MCLAVPARIVQLEGDNAVADAMGNRWNIKTSLLEDVKVGSLVLIHAGFAIATIEEEEARKTWQLIAELDEFENERGKHC